MSPSATPLSVRSPRSVERPAWSVRLNAPRPRGSAATSNGGQSGDRGMIHLLAAFCHSSDEASVIQPIHRLSMRSGSTIGATSSYCLFLCLKVTVEAGAGKGWEEGMVRGRFDTPRIVDFTCEV
jgi:hypothetical protein